MKRTSRNVITNSNILQFAEQFMDGDYVFKGKFTSGYTSFGAPSLEAFLVACAAKGYDINHPIELSVRDKEGVWLKYQLDGIIISKSPEPVAEKPVSTKSRATKPKRALKSRYTPEEKAIIDAAREDWNNQCKNFMLYKQPFRDKTAKACYERHKRQAGL